MIKSAVKALLATGTGFRLRSSLDARPKVAVLMYHRITTGSSLGEGLDLGVFVEQMRWLRRHCDPIGPEELFDRLTRRSVRLPVLVTFDDGYRDYAENAFPVLEQLGIPAVVFLATQFIDRGGLIWTERVSLAFQLSRCSEVELPWGSQPVLRLRNAHERARSANLVKSYLKSIDNTLRRELEDELIRRLDVLDALAQTPRQMLTWGEVRATAGLTRYGGHSHTHPILSRLSAAELDRELTVSRDRIVAETGRHPRWFAYPNGGREDIPEGIGARLEALGYEAAFSTIEGTNHAGVDRWAIRRQPTGAAHVRDFAWLMAS